MANIRSSIKRIRTSKRNFMRNSAVHSAIRTTIKKAEATIQKKDPQSNQWVAQAVKMVDTAVSHGIIHRNKAARQKSRLLKKLNSSTPAS